MKPTDRQIALLYDLKRAAGETFYYPPSRERASHEISRLQRQGGGAVSGRLPIIGRRVELARYATSAGERVLYGQRIDGVVRVVDTPVGPAGRTFLVERGLTTKAELDALVTDYVVESRERDEPAILIDGQAEAVSDA